jgi:type II secretory pathway component GspD/PulD (secretin)
LYYTTAEEAKKLIVPVLSSDAVVESTTPADTGVAEVSGGGGGGTTATASLGGDSMALHDMIIVYDYPEKIEVAAEVIRSIDIRPKQVLVEATILSAILTEGMDLGVNLNFMDGIAVDGFPAINLNIGAPIETTGFVLPPMNGLRVGVQSGDAMAFINALEAVTDTTVLANPKILAVNKQEGSVLIGNKLGYRSSTSISTGGVATEGEVEFLDTGTFLSFRPYIGNDGYIRMDIHPKDSSGTLNADGVPNENVTQCLSNVIVKDGETIVIGGLFRDVVVASRGQVPLLGDLPVIGALFRGTSDTMEREEVIILLTVNIIDEPADVEGVERANDIRRKRFGAKDALQWMGRPRLAEDYYTNAVESYLEGDFETAMGQLRFSLKRRPTYLEAIRLKERIISEASPADVEKLERIMLENIDEEEAPKWNRK